MSKLVKRAIGAIFAVLLLTGLLSGVIYSIANDAKLNREHSAEELNLTQQSSAIAEKCTEYLTSKSVSATLAAYCGDGSALENVSKETRTVKATKVLYDFEENPVFVAVEFNEGGYAIERINSKQIYERAENGSSPYSGISEKSYYLGTGLYYKRSGGRIVSADSNTPLSAAVKKALQSNLNETYAREAAFTSNVSAAAPLQQTAYGRDNVKLMGLMGTLSYPENVQRALYFPMLDYQRSGSFLYLNEATGMYDDAIYPANTGTSCSAVAATMILQYYDRLNIYYTVNPSFNTVIGEDFQYIIENRNKVLGFERLMNIMDPVYQYDNNLSEAENQRKKEELFLNAKPKRPKTQKLHDYIESQFDQGLFDETYNTGVAKFLNQYFKANHEPRLNAIAQGLWSNMKENIDKDMPCIGMTGLVASGDLLNGNNFVPYDIPRHQMVVYGYTLNSLGGLDEFVCHTGKRMSSTTSMSEIYTSGWSFAGNVLIKEAR